MPTKTEKSKIAKLGVDLSFNDALLIEILNHRRSPLSPGYTWVGYSERRNLLVVIDVAVNQYINSDYDKSKLCCLFLKLWWQRDKFHLLASSSLWSARQATFDFGDKYCQMELSDVVKKISRVVNRLSHWSSKVVTRCRQGCRGCILVITLVVTSCEQQSHPSSHKIHRVIS